MLFLQTFIQSLLAENIHNHLWKYFVSAFATFLLDLVLLWFFIEYTGMHYILAVVISFLISVSIQFLLIRYVFFRITHTSLAVSYTQFTAISTSGLILVTISVATAVEIFATPYILARIIAASITGAILFILHRRICLMPSHVHHSHLLKKKSLPLN
jgi:putative flippase GtrA